MHRQDTEKSCIQDCALYPFVDSELARLATNETDRLLRAGIHARRREMKQEAEDCKGNARTCVIAQYMMQLTTQIGTPPSSPEQA